MGQSPDSVNYTENSDDTVLIQGNADLNNGIVVPRIWSSQITKKSYPNDIIFTVRAPVGEIARNPYFATIGRGVASFKGNDFLYQSLIQKKENNYWNNISAGSTFDSINSDQLKNVIIDLPKNNLEQDKIGELFTKLDNLITLHQRKFNDILVYKLSTKFLFLKLAKNVWEQRKLGEIGYAKSGQGFPDAEQGGTKGIPFYKVSDMNIAGNENELITANNYVTLEQINKNHWNIINDVPAIFFAKVGAAVMLNRKRLCRNSFLLDNNTMAYMFDKSKWNYNFGKTLFDTIDLTLLAQIGAIPSYNASDVENIEILMPHLKEQDKIGELFTNLDNLITLHHRKYTYIFYSWEQRKLGEISNIVGGGTPSTEVESYWNGNINWYSPAEIGSQIYVSNSQRKITELGLEKSSARLLPVGTVLFTSRAGIGNMAILKEKACTNQGFQSIIPIKNKLNSYFIFSRSNELKKYAETVGAGSTFVEVSGKQMSEMEIKIPQIKEQVKIADLFTNLDNLITLHQHKELKRRNDNNEHLRW